MYLSFVPSLVTLDFDDLPQPIPANTKSERGTTHTVRFPDRCAIGDQRFLRCRIIKPSHDAPPGKKARRTNPERGA